MKATRFRGVEYGTDRPIEVGRIEEENGRITLATRYLDGDDRSWFPTWLGSKGEGSTPVPHGWKFPPETLAVLYSAPFEEIQA